ncbi:glycosyltransferase family 2 protein [Pelagibacterium lacus]|uniref:Glycosyltransferase family 2 protein n=1 Tax=Pelagibacterium lacus TaxID=2282655 RepID=A0A369W3M9_9HYPH|nr:glycosyltransferase family 2 protein [Pelagibacterium lacus]RDE09148.1 glycosyltransferase family 2 protein [Pelagibacterium lacus]
MSIPPKPKVSVLIQTLNEEANIAACLDCFSWCDDIVVLDSLSTDRTEEIARRYGVRWFERPFDGRASHQNWAMAHIAFKHPWVYYSDADERVPAELAAEIAQVTQEATPSVAAFRVNRRDYFEGRWIPRCTGYPLGIVRLFRPDRIRWERKANPVPIVDGEIGELKSEYHHYPFSKGLSHWVARHNTYSSYEAEETIRSLSAGGFHPRDLISRDRVVRRRALKALSFRLPARPLLKFCYFYVWKGGFLDGGPGLRYCLLQCFYEFLIVLKLRELRRGASEIEDR